MPLMALEYVLKKLPVLLWAFLKTPAFTQVVARFCDVDVLDTCVVCIQQKLNYKSKFPAPDGPFLGKCVAYVTKVTSSLSDNHL